MKQKKALFSQAGIAVLMWFLPAVIFLLLFAGNLLLLYRAEQLTYSLFRSQSRETVHEVGTRIENLFQERTNDLIVLRTLWQFYDESERKERFLTEASRVVHREPLYRNICYVDQDCVIRAVAPPDRQPELIGLDLTSLPGRAIVHAQVKQSGEPVTSPPMSFTDGHTGMMLWVPIGSAGDPDNPYLGAITGMFDIESVVRRVTSDSDFENFWIRIELHGKQIYSTVPEHYQPGKTLQTYSRSLPFFILGREWNVSVFPKESSLLARVPQGNRHTFFVNLVLSLIASALLAFSLAAIVRVARSQQKLKDSQRRFQTLFESAGDAIFVLDPKGQFLDVNSGACEMLGSERKQLLASSAVDVVAPGFSELFTERIGATEKGQVGIFETAFLSASGETVPIEASVRRIDYGGSPAILAVARDITERKRSEEELIRLATVIEQAAESVVITDPEGVINYVNPAFVKMSGYSRAEAIGKTPRLLKSGRHSSGFYRNLWNTLKCGANWQGRITNKRKDDTLYESETTISPVLDDAGRVKHYVSLSRDVTHEVRLQAQLRQAQKMEAIGTLAGGIAHDFNNILSAIMGYADLARNHAQDPERVERCLGEVLRAGERARELVKQILTFSRQTEQELKPMFMHPVVKEALKLLRGTIPRIIEIKSDIDEKCGPIMGDPTRIHQVVMNLCTNAYQAMSIEGGKLTVSLKEFEVNASNAESSLELRPGRFVRLSVSDTGCGIDEETKKRIFDPYFTTKEAGKGTGLGLASVHGIVKAHEGVISVDSAPGLGSTFHVYFPLCEKSEAPKTGIVEQGPLKIGSDSSEHILIIDDEQQIAQLGKHALEEMGYEVTMRMSSIDALEVFRTDPSRFDVVITDLNMPKMSGIELARRLIHLRPDIPIILCTGFSETFNERNIREAGIQEIVMKPIVIRDLAVAIRRVLDREEAVVK